MSAKTITSVHNQRVKDAVKLRDRRQRARQGRFVIDGAREILRALTAGVQCVEFFVCPELCHSPESRLVVDQLTATGAIASTADVWHVTPAVCEKMAFGQRFEGVLAVADTPRRALDDLNVAADAVIAVLAGVEKPGNVGAVLRSADAAGVAAVIAADPATDLYNPNCIRASLGTIFTQPVCTATSAETLAWLRARSRRIFTARLDASQNYLDVDLTAGAAIVLGSEAGGLSDAWNAEDITPIRLPMLGAADSLNVSATAAVLFYEALRQRTQR